MPDREIISKHLNKHNKPNKCELCTYEAAANKELNRHYWVYHKEYAKKKTIPSYQAQCESCGSNFRIDNLKRHQSTCKGPA